MAKIGFVGLGHMGLPMALNLMRAGHVVTGFDINPKAIEAFEDHQGLIAANLAELAASQDVIITMLQTGEQVKSIVLPPDGIFTHANKDILFIDCSTIDVESEREINASAYKHNIHAVDAPVSGGVASAEAGTLTFMVGGSEFNFQKAKPILEVMGKQIIHAGGGGSGQAAKICNNMILGISMIAVAEAFILAEKLGLSDEKLFEIVTNASGRCWSMDTYVPVPGILENVPANHNYQPGFAAAMMLKDLKLSQTSATSTKIKTPLGEAATNLYQKFCDAGYEGLDFSAIIKLLQT